MKQKYIDEIKGVLLLAGALLLLMSLISFVPSDLPWYTSQPNHPAKNLIRNAGAYTAGSFLFVFGCSSYFLVLLLFFFSLEKFSSRVLKFSFYKVLGLLVMFCALSSLFGMLGSQASSVRFGRSGIVGLVISDFLMTNFGRTGTFIILFAFATLALILIGEFLISPYLLKSPDFFLSLFDLIRKKLTGQREKIVQIKPSSKFQPKQAGLIEKLKQKQKDEQAALKKVLGGSSGQDRGLKEVPPAKIPPFKPPVSAPQPQIRIQTPAQKETAKEKEEPSVISEKPRINTNYRLPSLDLLSDPPPISARKLQDDLMSGAKVLEETLADFGVSVRVADVERGPVITRYELEPAPGVKVQRITALADDIALTMMAQTVRIVAPIPGKNRVGVEVPNSSSSIVYLKDVLANSEFTKGPKLNLALGKDIAGQSLIADLSEMPHLLIAGTTGAGKTVCLNSLIMSILFNATPEEVKFLLVDPKMVELSLYSGLPHALCPAVTDPKKVSAALNWVVSEMENRYTILAKEGTRNIQAHNAKGGSQLPYIVVIVDELADLMQVAAKQIESAITRLAQLSRAVGIHLILATQRPSVDVITGVIKANFPARVSFKVASKVDSRTVLDMNGADKLLGKGDMLFMKPGEAKPIRGQCCLVSDDEIQKVVEFIKQQQEPIYNETILTKQASSAAGLLDLQDELYDEAVQLVIETNQASVSVLQRRMRLGYTRAARLIDMMEQNGLVGPFAGSKAREILVNREEWLMKNMNTGTAGNFSDDAPADRVENNG